MKRMSPLFLLMLVGIGTLSLAATDYLDVQIRFFKGARKGEAEAPAAVTSSFLQPTITATIPTKSLPSEEIEQIKKVFNLESVSLITETAMSMEMEKGEMTTPKGMQKFRLNGQQYAFALFPMKSEYPFSSQGERVVHALPFRLLVYEIAETTKYALLDTQFVLPQENIAVFGFEDKAGIPYFLSFQVTRFEASAPPPPPPPPPPAAPKFKDIFSDEELKEFTGDAVVVMGEIGPPKLVKRVDPVYPEEARQARVEGVIILAVRTDEQGQVKAVKVMKSKTPILNKAAIDAVRQWSYKPLILNGKAREAVFMVSVRFQLKPEQRAGDEAVLRLAEGVKPPEVVKKVDPVYPEELRKEGIQGTVVLEVTTDTEGRVAKVKVLRSESELLNKPAVDAVRRWVYEVYHSQGKPTPVTFAVTISFRLK